jgi:hypothetical protein
MKKTLIFIMLLLLVGPLSAQYSITPSINNEYCPKVNYTFSVTISGYSPTISPLTNAPSVISATYPTPSPSASTTFTFVANFQDINVDQTFRVNYKRQGLSDTITDITFNKIKSLYFPSNNPDCNPIIQPNQISITSPSCQINTHTISFTSLKWYSNSSSAFCFGTVIDYEYLLPNGWKLGTITSNGISWILGNNNATITSDLNSGDGINIQVRPSNNSCSASLAFGQSSNIQIKRNPVFSIIPNSFQVPCGTSTTQTVTVNLSIPTGCTVTYNWALSNPYSYTYPGGGFVPQTFTTNTPTFTFVTPAISGILPSISVTPVYNGVSQPTLLCTASRTPIAPSQYPGFAIVGGNVICPSATYSAINIPAGFTLHWYTSTYPYGSTIALIDNPTANPINITSNGTGVISLIAELTNQCGQTVSVTKSNISVGGGIPPTAINGYFTNYLGLSESIHPSYYGCTQCVNNIQTATWSTVYISNSGLSNTTWSVVQANGNWIPFNSTTGTPSLQLKIPAANTTAIYRLTNTNSCGSQTFDFVFFAKDRPYLLAATLGEVYNLFPNPAVDVITVQQLPNSEQTASSDTKTANKQKNNNNIAENLIQKTSIKSIEIINLMGITQIKKVFSADNLKIVTIPLNKLSNGIYLMKIFDGKEWKSEKFTVQH